MINLESMEFVVYLTFKCNFNCLMCFQNQDFKRAKMKELSAEEWDILFDTLVKKIEHPRVVFMGREPLLHKDFDKIIRRAEKKGIYPTIITNGYLLENHLETLKQTDTGINLSILGLEKTHNRIVQSKNSFQKTVSLLEKVAEIKKKQKYKHFFCRTNTVILPDNIDELKDLTLFLEQFNPNGIRFEHPNFLSEKTEMTSHGICQKLGCGSDLALQLHVSQDFDFSNEEYQNKITEFFDWTKKHFRKGKILDFPNFYGEERAQFYDDEKMHLIRAERICSNPWRVPFFLPNGDVQNCLYSTVGNFLEEDFWSIWQGEKAERLRDYLKENKNVPSCPRCCCFYDASYIYAKGKKMTLPSGEKICFDEELNLVEAYYDGYFVFDDTKEMQNEYTPVKIMPFNTEKERKQIERCEKILGKLSDLKGVQNADR